MKLFDLEIWREAFYSLRSNRKRTIATAFGIFWGIFMLMVLQSISHGFTNGLNLQMSGLASNAMLLYVQPTSLPYKGYPKDRSWRLYLQDLEVLQRNIPEIRHIAPRLYGYRDISIRSGAKTASGDTYATTESCTQILFTDVLAGRLLTDMDSQLKRRYCTIGEEISHKLFSSHEEAIGRTVEINGVYYTVVGVHRPKSSGMNIDRDDREMVRLPYRVLSSIGYRQPGDVDFILLSLAGDGSNNKAIAQQITSLLRTRHQIHPKDESAIQVLDFSQMIRFSSKFLFAINLFVWFIAIATVLTGVIGISNIMLISIKERTRELGVRRAIGAKPKDILMLVILESLMISLCAGLIGILLGVGVMAMVDHLMSMNPDSSRMYQDGLISFAGAIAALALVVVSGVLGGILPSQHALKIKAIEAIREE